MIGLTKERKQYLSGVICLLFISICRRTLITFKIEILFCGYDYCDDNMKSKSSYIISLKLILVDAKNQVSPSKNEKKSDRDIFKALELDLHIAVF